MGRHPPRNPTNWHPDWYGFLEVAARQVLAAARRATLVEVEDLIAVAWLKVMRYRDPVPESTVWRYVKREMFHELERWYAGVSFDEDLDVPYEGPEDVGIAAMLQNLDSGIDLASELVRLNRRSRAVAQRILMGQSSEQIGRAMGVSRESVRKWRIKMSGDPVMVEMSRRQRGR